MKLENIKKAVKISNSYRQTLKNMGFNTSGGNYKSLKKKIIKNNIDISHFLTRKEIIELCNEKTRLTNDEIFTVNKSISPGTVRRRILEETLIEYKCNKCGINEWNGEKITLHLDHINGENIDHQISNLRFLCPNCHSQTKTYAGRNKISSINKRKKKEERLKRKNENKRKTTKYWKKLIQENNIDFSKKTWGEKVSKIMNKSPQYCLKFVKENLPELIEI